MMRIMRFQALALLLAGLMAICALLWAWSEVATSPVERAALAFLVGWHTGDFGAVWDNMSTDTRVPFQRFGRAAFVRYMPYRKAPLMVHAHGHVESCTDVVAGDEKLVTAAISGNLMVNGKEQPATTMRDGVTMVQEGNNWKAQLPAPVASELAEQLPAAYLGPYEQARRAKDWSALAKTFTSQFLTRKYEPGPYAGQLRASCEQQEAKWGDLQAISRTPTMIRQEGDRVVVPSRWMFKRLTDELIANPDFDFYLVWSATAGMYLIDDIKASDTWADYKGGLSKALKDIGNSSVPVYMSQPAVGPSGESLFEGMVSLADKVVGTGLAFTPGAAEEEAARSALGNRNLLTPQRGPSASVPAAPDVH